MAELNGLRDRARELAKVEGFGSRLRSGIALATKFEKKATGGDYPLDRAIADHIEVVQQMQNVFEQIEGKYSSAEELGKRGITAAGAPLSG
ncbi:hypothetical protein [Rhodococcus sp. NPDC059234]|uniref:hypothetical protein n=1 Tax=Rhodococcus sp. NPDC059234 TaxID=3346781 RepID=UPI00366A7176